LRTMIDDELVQLYKEHKASDMDEKMLFYKLMQSLEGDDVKRERALALVYELRDRSDAFNTEQ